MSAAKNGGTRRTWSLEERQRIVAEALAPGESVAAVARRHGLNANLVFKWVRRSREGWLDRRRAPAKETGPRERRRNWPHRPSFPSSCWSCSRLR
jgi:transposase